GPLGAVPLPVLAGVVLGTRLHGVHLGLPGAAVDALGAVAGLAHGLVATLDRADQDGHARGHHELLSRVSAALRSRYSAGRACAGWRSAGAGGCSAATGRQPCPRTMCTSSAAHA